MKYNLVKEDTLSDMVRYMKDDVGLVHQVNTFVLLLIIVELLHIINTFVMLIAWIQVRFLLSNRIWI